MRFRAARWFFVGSVPALAAAAPALATGGCAPSMSASTPSAPAAQAALRGEAMRLPADPMVRGARLVPIASPARDDRGLGVEPGGGVRSMAAGVRVVSLPAGAIEVADDRLPAQPSLTPTRLPDRLGGGFLFVVNETTVWRADRWLGPARPIYTSPGHIVRIEPGLDRVYILANPTIGSGYWRAFDGRTGERVAMGPWPASPTVSSYAAADGWRALAIADLRGPVATFNAGATWQPLRLPFDAREVAVAGESLVVRAEGSRDSRDARYEVRPDGQVLRLPDAPPAPFPSAASAAPAIDATATDRASAAGPLGARPLLAVVEDGWPLDDGTALVARDGALARVRLEDGAIADVALGAYPLRPSRCHPVPLGPLAPPAPAGRLGPVGAGGPDGIGFVCGEPRGATAIYSLDPARGRLDEIRRFDAPRAVIASGNGALAVHGPCDAHGGDDAKPASRAYCVRSREGAWREIHVEGAVGGERVVVLADGRFVIVSPPQGDLAAARLTLLEGERARSVPVTIARVTDDVRRVLDVGVWLDGFEERRPGVLGGWIEAAGTMLGIEIALDGQARVGPYRRDAGLPMVSGRYGLGWSASRQGYETTDGGMTWTTVDVPEPIAPARLVTSRACGPIGCAAAGWLRVGWGDPRSEPAPPAPVARPLLGRTYLSLPLECEIEGSAPASPKPGAPVTPPGAGRDDRVVSYEVGDTFERGGRFGPLGKVVAWGPKSGEWEHTARWQVRWSWPFSPTSESHASAPAAAPSPLVDVARLGSSMTAMLPFLWTIAPGDDATHALLVAHRHLRGDASVFELEADRPPLEIRRADGEPFGEIDGAMRAGGRWWLITPARTGERSESVVWQLEGPIARELARVPRAGVAARPTSPRLAWKTDGRALGVVVDGQPGADRSGPTRWVASIDPETGALGGVEPLGSSDLSDRASLAACGGDEIGWRLDVPAQFPIGIASASTGGVPGDPIGSLHGALARMVIAESRGCVTRVTGAIDVELDERALRRPPPTGASISVAVVAGRERRALRCAVR